MSEFSSSSSTISVEVDGGGSFKIDPASQLVSPIGGWDLVVGIKSRFWTIPIPDGGEPCRINLQSKYDSWCKLRPNGLNLGRLER